ncbi:hypothetical protein SBA4_3030037 [Candidatus Sulfopaludibacter sp. SbA4]|nr:hypothetical protein SBA4_3030037 [Candidatus Sulfopaludibacter sp. SbA4]
MSEHLSAALLRNLFRAVTATMCGLIRPQRKQELRTGEAVSPEQRGNHERRHDRVGDCPRQIVF